MNERNQRKERKEPNETTVNGFFLLYFFCVKEFFNSIQTNYKSISQKEYKGIENREVEVGMRMVGVGVYRIEKEEFNLSRSQSLYILCE